MRSTRKPERHALLIGVRPEMRGAYLELHRQVWAGVEETLSLNGVTNYSIFVRENILMAYYEYIGEDHDRSMDTIAEDPTTREWWKLTDPCQVGLFPNDPTASGWADFEEVWHLE